MVCESGDAVAKLLIEAPRRVIAFIYEQKRLIAAGSKAISFGFLHESTTNAALSARWQHGKQVNI
jgi:hypothetical protein